MAEQEDAQDLKSCGQFVHAGSSPALSIDKSIPCRAVLREATPARARKRRVRRNAPLNRGSRSEICQGFVLIGENNNEVMAY